MNRLLLLINSNARIAKKEISGQVLTPSAW